MAYVNDDMVENAITSQIRALQYSQSLNREAYRRVTVAFKAMGALMKNTPERMTPKRQRILRKAIRKHLIKLRSDLRVIMGEGAAEIGVIMSNRELRDFSKLLPGETFKKPSRRSVVAAVKNSELAGMGNIYQAIGTYINSIDRRAVSAIRSNSADELGTAALVRSFSGNGTASVRAAAKRALGVVVRTASTAASSAARTAFALENKRIITGMRWVSALDDRTSTTCANLDGRVFPVGGRQPPAHPNCRSAMVFELKNADRITSSPGSMRASKDGPVSGKLTYKGYLQNKINNDPKSIIKTFGPTKGKLLLDKGAGEISKFVDSDLKPLSVAKIIQKS